MFTVLPSYALVLIAIATSVTALLAVRPGRRPSGSSGPTIFAEDPGRTEYLFDGETLVDATPAARAMLAGGPQGAGSQWGRLMAFLEPHFPDTARGLAGLEESGGFSLVSERADAAPLMLTVELRGGLTRIAVTDPEAADGDGELSAVAHRALCDEVAQLRATVATAPLPMWRQTEGGDVVWANAAYLTLVLTRLGPEEDLTWPLPRIFDRTACATGTERQRHRIGPVPAEGPRDAGGGVPQGWFDLCGSDGPDGRTIFATPCDQTVRAEVSLRNFMQTLTKTFAHLSTGLAIFDHNRQLALFNPALIDLTSLPPDMLSARPSLLAFFDALRDRSMIPEPRDYRAWRRRITDIEEAALNGHYQDVWSLPGGQTYRVTGRPHPNGALALMIEDISSEMSQTRRYQADLELGQAVIDAMDEAIAVFGPSGSMVMSNRAYSGLWGHDPAGSLAADGGIGAICAHWRDRAAPSGLWDRAEDFVATLGPREAWSDKTFLSDGRHLACRLAPLSGGATLIGFTLGIADEAALADERMTA